jgi:CubicO group peptidase (beta-lactamase class C family)
MNSKALERSIEFIDSWLAFQYEREDYPGYVVTISYKGKVLLNKAYGYADLESKTKLTPENIFRIASHSKTFTATALLQLQEKGKLKIDDYAVDYLPWLKKHVDKRWQKITLRQLMSHGAGVIRDGLNSDYWQLSRPFPNADQFKEEMLKENLVIDNNVKLKYSNYGYTLLGMVIESVSGQPYNKYVIEHIIKPLGIKNTGPEYTPTIDDKLVTGYTRADINKKRLPIAQVDTRAMASATGFYGTGEDLCTYFTALMVGSNRLLSDESKKEMQRVQWHAKTPGEYSHADYGLGLEIEYLDKRQTFGHGGGFPGHITSSIADPKDELVVVVLTNSIDGISNWINKSIYKIIENYQQYSPDYKPKHDMSHLEGRYMSLWSITDIVVTGDKVVATYSNSWEPFNGAEELSYEEANVLKVIDTSSFSSEDELVHFNVKNGKVESINYNGTTMLPEKIWLEQQKKKKVVE